MAAFDLMVRSGGTSRLPMGRLQTTISIFRSGDRDLPCGWCSRLDKDFSFFHDGGISLDRNHARWPHDCSGPDIELPTVKIALDDVPLDEAFRQGAGAVRAVVVGFEELAVALEDGNRQIILLHL